MGHLVRFIRLPSAKQILALVLASCLPVILLRWLSQSKPLINDKYTVLLLTYKRDATLRATLREISDDYTPSLHKIIIIWQDSLREPPADLAQTISSFKVPVLLRRSTTNSLNNRFLPDKHIETAAVMSRDDDLSFGKEDVEFQFRQWYANGRDQAVGTTPREVMPSERVPGKWVYRMKNLRKYQIILMNAGFFHKRFLDVYWSTDAAAENVRNFVEQGRNCEDIAMNFFIANTTKLPPLLVETKEPRRYYRQAGISDDPQHFQIRANCYDVFANRFRFHLPSSTEAIRRHRGEIRDWWDSLPAPDAEIQDEPSANEIDRMEFVVKELEREALTVRDRDRLEAGQAELVNGLRKQIKFLESTVRNLETRQFQQMPI